MAPPGPVLHLRSLLDGLLHAFAMCRWEVLPFGTTWAASCAKQLGFPLVDIWRLIPFQVRPDKMYKGLILRQQTYHVKHHPYITAHSHRVLSEPQENPQQCWTKGWTWEKLVIEGLSLI